MDEEKRKLLAEEVNEILRERIQYIQKYYPHVRDAYLNQYDWPELDPLRHEIALCITLGLFQAAIALTNHFLESLLKNALIVHSSNKTIAAHDGNVIAAFIEGTAEARAKYGGAELGDTINGLRKAGLITKEQKKKLDQLRKSMRNAYSHADRDKTFGDRTVPVQPVELEDGKFEVGEREEVNLAELIIVQGIAQAMLAEQKAPGYFLYVDRLARDLWEKLFGSNEEAV